jgi:hypothetical protein
MADSLGIIFYLEHQGKLILLTPSLFEDYITLSKRHQSAETGVWRRCLISRKGWGRKAISASGSG